MKAVLISLLQSPHDTSTDICLAGVRGELRHVFRICWGGLEDMLEGFWGYSGMVVDDVQYIV